MDARAVACVRECLTEVPSLRSEDTSKSSTIGDGLAGSSTGDYADMDLIRAAVLVPIVSRPNGPSILLTERSPEMEKHAGQVSFPGGHVEESDDGYIAAALRETQEETGIAPEYVTVLGGLDECRTGTGFRIAPVVGLVERGFSLTPERSEVAEIFEVPMSYLFDPTNHGRGSFERNGRHREFYDINYEGHRIWGATAAMLINFYSKLDELNYVHYVTNP